MFSKSITLKLILSTIVLIVAACNKGTEPPQASVPVLTTTTVTIISSASAATGGNITSDGGAAVTARGVCWSKNTTPTITDSKTIDGSGTGSFTSTITALDSNTTYNVRAYATNSAGTGYGNTVTFTSSTSSENTVTDIDGNIYRTVRIGNQVWMVENLKVKHDLQGNPIQSYVYNNDQNNEHTYGRLYSWDVIMNGLNQEGTQGIAPNGWHIPSDADWTELINYLGGELLAGGKMKESGTSHWINPNSGATNESGFTTLPGGIRRTDGSFINLSGDAYFWTSTEVNSASSKYLNLGYGNEGVFRSNIEKAYCLSVRCIKN
jgi:uncharacterized protein (TIGR02145 family)